VALPAGGSGGYRWLKLGPASPLAPLEHPAVRSRRISGVIWAATFAWAWKQTRCRRHLWRFGMNSRNCRCALFRLFGSCWPGGEAGPLDWFFGFWRAGHADGGDCQEGWADAVQSCPLDQSNLREVSFRPHLLARMAYQMRVAESAAWLRWFLNAGASVIARWC